MNITYPDTHPKYNDTQNISLQKILQILAPLIMLLFCGCAISRDIVTIPHVDGSGSTRYKYIAAGGVIRPGIIVVVQETIGSNQPVVLSQANGTPLAPAVFGVAGNVGTALALGSTWPENQENVSTTVVQPANISIPNPPRADPIFPPGPPPWHRSPHRSPNHH